MAVGCDFLSEVSLTGVPRIRLSQLFPRLPAPDFLHAAQHSCPPHASRTDVTCLPRLFLTDVPQAHLLTHIARTTTSHRGRFARALGTPPLHPRPLPTRRSADGRPAHPESRATPGLGDPRRGRAVPLGDDAVCPEIRADPASLWRPCGQVCGYRASI
jgi:hypothetical protein